MRFIHTSDWQLGKPFGNAPPEARAALQEARLDAIGSIASTARRDGASIVLVAGDIFDSAEPGDRVFRQALLRMRDASDLGWYLLPGNHDPARADGLWTRLVREAPANVTACLEPRPIALGEQAWLLPAPLQLKRALEDPTAWFASAATPPGALRVGLAHGSIREFGSRVAQSNLIPPDRASRSGLDYLALGDWHGRLRVDAWTYYSGTPEPDDFGNGNRGLVLSVDVHGGSVPQVSDVAVGRHVWLAADWQTSPEFDISAKLDSLTAGLERSSVVARIKLRGLVSLAERVQLRDQLEAEFAHEVRWLQLDLRDLHSRATDEDLSGIDAEGFLSEVAHRLSRKAGPDAEGRRAAAALERLYVEHLRAQRLGSG
jgi:DNA repair exonuclease SbcCD nuclease subunit